MSAGLRRRAFERSIRAPGVWPLLLMAMLAGVLPSQRCWAQTSAPAAAHAWREQHERDILNEFNSLLAIPNVASDEANIERNAKALLAMLEKRGVSARLLRIPGAPPVVNGEIRTSGAGHTIVFYAHYDGQPVTPSDWEGGRAICACRTNGGRGAAYLCPFLLR